MITLKQLLEMKNTSLDSIDRNNLVDIAEVKINPNLPKQERILDFIRQIKNPYCFRCGEITVKMSFEDTDSTLEDNLESFLRNL